MEIRGLREVAANAQNLNKNFEDAKKQLQTCSDQLRAQQTNVSALQMQVATIANYQTQIDQLNSQLKDAKA